MKKFFPIALVAAAAIMFTSCKKEYTCECVTSGTGTSGATVTYKFTDTKSNAESKCSAMNVSVTSGGASASQTCTIK